jgi:dihydroorotate dehydrogenase (NAD+) catalytic subunit
MTVDLRVEFAGLKLRNPILVASGTFGYGVEFAEQVDLNCLGGIVVKGLSAQPMEGAPAPRLCETASGMLNAVGLQNIGVRRFIEEKLPALRGYDTAIIANVFGHTVEEYVEVIEQLEQAEGVAAYELNISCPNVKKGGVRNQSRFDPRSREGGAKGGAPAGADCETLTQRDRHPRVGGRRR